jgi:hypothetical protein
MKNLLTIGLLFLAQLSFAQEVTENVIFNELNNTVQTVTRTTYENGSYIEVADVPVADSLKANLFYALIEKAVENQEQKLNESEADSAKLAKLSNQMTEANVQDYLEYTTEKVYKKMAGEWKLTYDDKSKNLTFVDGLFIANEKEVGSIIVRTKRVFKLKYKKDTLRMKKQSSNLWVGKLGNTVYTLTRN